MNSRTYKGYFARIEFGPIDAIFTGLLAGVNDIIGFHAGTAESLEAEVHVCAALAAQVSGKSLNQWAGEALREAAGRGLKGA